MDDRFLVEQSAQNNTDAFRLLILRYQRMVFSYLGNFQLPAQVLEDLAQETFLRAYNGVFYLQGATRNDISVSVPEGCCFVLGDNRDNSTDSRHWGCVPLIDIISKPRLVYFSIDPEGGVRWGRIGKLL